MLAGPGAELFDIVIRMDGLGTFSDEIENCVEIPLGRYQLKVLALDRILASKIAANRPKDMLTIPVLGDALAAIQFIMLVSPITIDTNSMFLVVMQQVGDMGPPAMFNLRAIHFRVMVVACRNRRATATLLLSPLASPAKRCSLQPRRAFSRARGVEAFPVRFAPCPGGEV
jgi:hypothetical protein